MITGDPARPVPAHLGQPARIAASSNGRAGRSPANGWAASVSIQLLSMFEAFLAIPLWMVAGSRIPPALPLEMLDQRTRGCATAAGAELRRAAMRWRHQSPVSVSDQAP